MHYNLEILFPALGNFCLIITQEVKKLLFLDLV